LTRKTRDLLSVYTGNLFEILILISHFRFQSRKARRSWCCLVC